MFRWFDVGKRLAVLMTLGIVTATLVTACGQVTFILQQYDGPARAREQVGVLRVQPDDPAQLVSMDGDALGQQKLDSDVRLHIEVLPGKHTLRVKNPKAQGVTTQDVSFVAKGGSTYRVEIVEREWHTLGSGAGRPGAWSALVYEIRNSDGRPLREVSLPPG
jgi:hypothetical protein